MSLGKQDVVVVSLVSTLGWLKGFPLGETGLAVRISHATAGAVGYTLDRFHRIDRDCAGVYSTLRLSVKGTQIMFVCYKLT
jgi:hypothetical protein